ncbi:MAG: squalene/phytoene synthase family protein [Pseudomonadota bacterium]
MKDQPAEPADYCEWFLKSRDEDRWLASRYAQDAMRHRLVALYVLLGELRRVPRAVSEPALGEIRLQWWRDALGEIRDARLPRAHPVVEALARADLSAAPIETLIDTAIDAAARPLYEAHFTSADDLISWLAKIEGGIDAAAARLAGADAEIAAAACRGGSALAAARDVWRLAPQLSDDVAARAKAIYEEAREILAKAPPAISPTLLHFSLTPVYLSRKGAAFPLVKRGRLFAAMATGKI